jgi:hypothetical protein
MFQVRQAYAQRVKEAIDTLAEAFGHTFAGDMLITLDRNVSFFEDRRFMQAFEPAALDETEKSLIWRVHVLCWCASNALRAEGDYVECGVFRGLSTAVAARYLDFGGQPRAWYLYDTFQGIPADQPNPGQSSPPYYEERELYESVVRRFAEYGNIHVLRGRIPEVLAERAPARVAFLHLDLNSAVAEEAALEYFAGRFAPGAFVVLDDYGWRGFRPQKLVADRVFGRLGKPIMELPTGQGIVMI